MVLASVLGGAGNEAPADDGAALRDTHAALDLPGHRVELLEGRIVVSPAQNKLHNRIVTWLNDSLREFCNAHGWDRLAAGTVELATTGDRVQPDLLVCQADRSTDGIWLIPDENVMLVAEVAATAGRRADYEVKRTACAHSGIPIYLVVDPGEELITLFAGPSTRGYMRATTVAIGDKLDLPEPFAITLDTATMPGGPAGP